MKAQVAVEYLIIVGMGLILILFTGSYLMKIFVEYSDQNRISLAKNAVNKIGEAVDMVYSQGPPSRLKIEITLPDGIEEVSLSNKTILLKIKTKVGLTDVYYNTIAEINGEIPSKKGNYYLSIVADQEAVNISVV